MTIEVRLPDDSSRQLAEGATGADLAGGVGINLAAVGDDERVTEGVGVRTDIDLAAGGIGNQTILPHPEHVVRAGGGPGRDLGPANINATRSKKNRGSIAGRVRARNGPQVVQTLPANRGPGAGNISAIGDDDAGVDRP